MIGPMRKWYVVFTMLIVLMLVVFESYLLGEKVIQGDATLYQIPHFIFFKEALEMGESFLWNPLNGGGIPVFAGLNGFFSPLHYIALSFFEPVFAFHFLIFLSATLSLYFMIVLCRKLGMSMFGASIAGLSFVISEIVYLVHTTTLSWALVVLPLLFFFILKIEEGNRWKHYSTFLTLLIVFAWLTVFPQFVILILLTALAFSLYRSYILKNSRLTKIFIICALIATLIGSIQIVPTYFAGTESVRGNIQLPRNELNDRSIRIQDLPRLFFPDSYTSMPLYMSDGKYSPSEAYLYMGIIPFCFFVFSFLYKNSFLRFFRWIFFICFLVSLRFSPLFWILTHVPVLGDFRVPSRYMIIGSFAGAIIAGFGAHFFMDEDNADKLVLLKNTLKILFFLIIIMVLTFPFLVWIVSSVFPHPFFGTEKIQFVIGLVQNMTLLLKSAFDRTFIPLVLLLFAYIFLIGYIRKNISMRRLSVIFILLTIADFIFVSEFYIPHQPMLYPKHNNELVTFLKTKEEGRLATFFQSSYDGTIKKLNILDTAITQNDWRHAELSTWNTNLLYSLESIDAYEKLVPYNVARLMNVIGSGKANENFGFNHIPTSNEQQSLINFLGVRYVVSDTDIPYMKKIFNYQFVTGGESYPHTFSLFENMSSKPRMYFVDSIEAAPYDEEVYRMFKNSEYSKYIITCSDCENYTFTGKGDIEIKHRENNRMEAITDSETAQFLIFSQNYYPGWRAYIDGQETSVFKVNTVHMGIELPSGKHTVLFIFTYLSYIKDRLLSLSFF